VKKECCAPPLLNPGDLRHRIVIEQYTETQDSTGQPTRGYTTFATSRASIEPLGGRELFDAQSVMPEANTRIRLWYLAGLTEKMRILFEGVYYNILNVRDIDMLHRVMELTCASGLTDEG
jgi:SPP1 family predicted phage head-tail adaptor